MRLYLNTSEATTELRIDEKCYFCDTRNGLAEGIFSFIKEKLAENNYSWTDITEIEFFTGPGSFTGLRIGAAVVNALADGLSIPIFDQNGRQHKIVLPDYGRPARITAPRK